MEFSKLINYSTNMLCWRGQGMEVNNNVASCLFTSTWFVGSSWEVDTMEQCSYDLVTHFEACWKGIIMNCEFISWETSWNISYFKFCWFKLAISGKAIKPAGGLFSFSSSRDTTSRQVWISMKFHPSFWNLFCMVKIKGVVGISNFFSILSGTFAVIQLPHDLWKIGAHTE